MIPPLPDPIDIANIPSYFRPSEICQATECPLKCVLGYSLDSSSRLPTHPAAELGRVFHALLERAGKGAIERLASPRLSVNTEFERLLTQWAIRLSADPATSHFAELKNSLGTVVWHNKTRDVLMTAEALLQNAPLPRCRDSRATVSYELESLPKRGRFHEVVFTSDIHRISGRIDSVEKLDANRIVITEYKSGIVYDRKGDVLPHISLQLRLYALALESCEPGVDIELVVVQGAVARSVPWDNASRDATLSYLESFLDQFPANTSMSARSMARPGPWCAQCSYRHVCGTYLDSAPGLWESGASDGPLPNDTWGSAIKCTQSDSGLILDLLDSSQRNVRIQRIDLRHGDSNDFQSGKELYFFGLSSNSSVEYRKRMVHPRNFYELPADQHDNRAWSLAIFCK